MGFGTLLCGYLFLLNLGVYEGFTNIIGYLLMLYGCLKLQVFNKGLRFAFFSLIPLALLGAADFAVTGLEFLSLYTVTDEMNTAFAIATKLLTMLFTVLLLGGIRDLAVETGIPVLEGRASRNRFFTYVYYVFAAALEVTTYTPEATRFAVYAVIPVTICGFVVILLNAQVLHNAFRWICMPEDILPVVTDTEDGGDRHLPPLGKK